MIIQSSMASNPIWKKILWINYYFVVKIKKFLKKINKLPYEFLNRNLSSTEQNLEKTLNNMRNWNKSCPSTNDFLHYKKLISITSLPDRKYPLLMSEIDLTARQKGLQISQKAWMIRWLIIPLKITKISA